MVGLDNVADKQFLESMTALVIGVVTALKCTCTSIKIEIYNH